MLLSLPRMMWRFRASISNGLTTLVAGWWEPDPESRGSFTRPQASILGQGRKQLYSLATTCRKDPVCETFQNHNDFDAQGVLSLIL